MLPLSVNKTLPTMLEPVPDAVPSKVPATSRPRSARTLRDFALVQRIHDQQDEKAYAELLAYYYIPMKRFVRRRVNQPAETDDLTLEIFTRAFRHMNSFRPEYAFSTWLFRVAANYCIDYLRRAHLRTTSLQTLVVNDTGECMPLEVVDMAPTPYELVVEEQQAHHLRQAVAQLTPKCRQVIQLFYFEELSYVEVATALQVPLSTVKARLFHGKAQLHCVLRAHAFRSCFES
jgi:RNA polymerase sigma factor (sigma-70 family)